MEYEVTMTGRTHCHDFTTKLLNFWNLLTSRRMLTWSVSRLADFAFRLCGEVEECSMSMNSSKDTWWSNVDTSNSKTFLRFVYSFLKSSAPHVKTKIHMAKTCKDTVQGTPINIFSNSWLPSSSLAISIGIHGVKIEISTSSEAAKFHAQIFTHFAGLIRTLFPQAT